MTGNVVPTYRGNSLHGKLAAYLEASAAKKAAADTEAELRAEILLKLQGRAILRVGDYLVRVRSVPAVLARTIMQEDVGRPLKGRKAHKVLTIDALEAEPAPAEGASS